MRTHSVIRQQDISYDLRSLLFDGASGGGRGQGGKVGRGGGSGSGTGCQWAVWDAAAVLHIIISRSLTLIG